MRLASLVVASFVLSAPAIALGQGMDVPTSAPPAVAPPPAPPAPAAAPAPQPVAAPAMAAPPAIGAPTSPSPQGAPATGVPGPKPQKNGGYVGFSVVTGKGTVYLGGQSADIDEALAIVSGITGGSSPTTLGMMLRLGWGNGDFLFGGQFNWVRSFIDINGISAGYDFRGFDLAATWWSQEMGIYGRVGIGPAQYRVFSGNSESDPVDGVELMAGFGATMGGLGVGIDFIRQNYDATKTGFDAVTYVLAGFSLDLY